MAGLSSFGVILDWWDGTTWTPIAKVGDVEGPGLEVGTEETTTHDSPNAWEEYVPTTVSGGEVSLTINWTPSDATHAWTGNGLAALAISRQPQRFRVRYPDPNWNKALEFDAIVTEFSPKGPVKGKMEADVTLKVTGPVNEVTV